MPHTKCHRIRVLQEMLLKAQQDRTAALQARDRALAEVEALKLGWKNERSISRVYEKLAKMRGSDE